MDVGIRELRARLSELLDRAAGGETIRVTERGRPKALLGPIPGGGAIERGIEEGWITPPTREPTFKRRLGLRGSMTIAEVLAEDRGE